MQWVRKLLLGVAEFCFVGADSAHPDIGFAMQVAFVAGGCMHSQYHRVLSLSLGMKSFGYNTFNETVEQMSMPVLELLRDQCKEAKDDMRALPATQIVGSML